MARAAQRTLQQSGDLKIARFARFIYSPAAELKAFGSSYSISDSDRRMAATRPRQVRKKISVTIRDEVLREAGYKCGNPVCRNILTLQLHHIEWVKEGGENAATNLLALCGHCHDLHTQGHIPASAIRHWKGILHALNSAFNEESMDLLLFLASADCVKILYTGDGLLRFAGLIASGLRKSSTRTMESV